MTVAELLSEFQRLGVRLSVNDNKLVVDAPAGVVSADLAAGIRKNKTELLELFSEVSAAAAEEAFELLPAGNENRLSLTQERIWAIDQLQPGNGQFNLPGCWWLVGDLDAERFESALNWLVESHHIFKRRFETLDGKAVMSEPTHAGVNYRRLTMADINLESSDDHDIADWLAEISREPFDLTNEPLLKVFLLEVDEKRNLLVVISHTAIWDAWCYDLFLNELGKLYEQNKPDDSPPEHQYADYVKWQRERQSSESVVAALQKEMQRLETVQHRAELPCDFPNPDPADHSGARYNFFVPPELRRQVTEAARKAGATPFMVLLTSYATLLGRYANQESVVITVPLRGREKRQFEGIFGPFTNNLFLPINSGEHTFSTLLEVVKKDIGDAFSSEIPPFERLVEGLNQDLSASAFFQLHFSFQNVEDRQTNWATGLVLQMGPQQNFHATHADISFWLREGRDTIDGAIDYRTPFFREETIAQFHLRMLKLTSEGIQFPDTPLNDLLMGEDELSVSSGPAIMPYKVLARLIPAMQKRGESIVCRSPVANISASDLLAVLPENSESVSDPFLGGILPAIRLIMAVAETELSFSKVRASLGALPVSQINLAVDAWDSRFSESDRRVLIIDPENDVSTCIAWLATVAAGKTLCLPEFRQTEDEVSIRNLIESTDADVVYLPSTLMQALLSQEDPPTHPKYIVRALPGGSSVIDECRKLKLNVRWVFADHSTLGIGLIGSASSWPHVFETVENGITAGVLDDAGRAQLTGVDGKLALGFHDTELECVWPSTTVRQNTAGYICWPDADASMAQPLDHVVDDLLALDDIVDAHAALRGNDPLSARIIAWVVQAYGAETTSTEIRDRLQAAGSSSQPALIICVDEIPRGKGGHVLDRDLLHPDSTIAYVGFEPPTTDREKAFAGIWRQTLGIERIGANDTFANVGGNSVQALVVLSETQKQLGWSFEPRLLFFQSLRQIAERGVLAEQGEVA